MVEEGHRKLPTTWRDALYTPITLEELQLVMNKGGETKAPSRDGLCLEFFIGKWGSFKGGTLVLLIKCS